MTVKPPNAAPIAQYQARDRDVVDYELFTVPGVPYKLRGPDPRPLKDGEFLALVGASQTFGTLVKRPFAHMIRDTFKVQILNLGVGGAAPALFLEPRNAALLEHANRSRLTIVQAMSARSSQTRYFETQFGKNMLRRRGSTDPFVPGDTAWKQFFATEPESVRQEVVEEVRANWVTETIEVLKQLKTPKIFLWFSKASPDRKLPLNSYATASGVFPQFVDRRMLSAIEPHVDAMVDATTSRGSPQKLINRFTGEPAMVNLGDSKTPRDTDGYYPSPEMHEDAFERLKTVLPRFLGQQAKRA
jgi:hypothetical protein